MNSLLLFLILIALIAITFLLNIIARRLENMCDLSKEDEAVKLATEEVKAAKKNVDKAKQRIPSDKATN